MYFPTESKDRKKLETNKQKNRPQCFYHTTKYISRHNSKRKHQVILLAIKDGEKWHYLVVKSLSRSLREITSTNDDEFYELLPLIQNKKHNYNNLKKPEARNKILKFPQNHKSMKVSFVIYVDTESLLEKNIHM